MAILSAADRQRIANGLQRYWSRRNEAGVGIMNKSDHLSAVGAVDSWVDSNQTAFNNALPTVAKDNLSLAQKSFILMVVVAMRAGLGFLRTLVGEVD